jgi:hypothetical protein
MSNARKDSALSRRILRSWEAEGATLTARLTRRQENFAVCLGGIQGKNDVGKAELTIVPV